LCFHHNHKEYYLSVVIQEIIDASILLPV